MTTQPQCRPLALARPANKGVRDKMWTCVAELEVHCPTPYPSVHCYGDTEWLGAIFNPRVGVVSNYSQ